VLAFQALYAWEALKAPASELASLGWLEEDKKAALDDKSMIFIRFLILGVIECVEEVDAAIKAQLQNWEIDRLAKVDLSILRLGAYSLMKQPEIPATITIDESIEIAKEYGAPDSYKFVNGVLDGLRKAMEAGKGP
jgi:N utilization substance protein B